MRASSFRLVFFVFVLFPLTARGHEARPTEADFTTETLMQGVVRIENTVADIFAPEPERSHGTGFVIRPGLIFTNQHVIERKQLEAQRLLLHFNVPNARNETVVARLVYESPLHDFAVLAYDPKKLRRAKVRPLRVPEPGSFFYDYARNEMQLIGRQVLAIGNPYDSSNIFSYGAITGKNSHPTQGPYIQTQTPINPGNSGGPLLSVETGEVIGINTAKISGGDNVGFVTPIAPLLEEFALFQRQVAEGIRPNASQQREQIFHISRLEEDNLRLTGQYAAIKKVIPDYWAQTDGALVVTDVPAGSPFFKDDVLLKLNGEPIKGIPYNLFRHLQRAGNGVRLTVLRGSSVVEVDTEMRGTGYNARRADIDYVMLSGMFFREFPVGATPQLYPGIETRVTMQALIDSAATIFNEEAYPHVGSLLQAVNFGGEDYEIRTLLDLKRAINANRNKKFIRMRMYRANRMRINGTQDVDLTSPVTGAPLIDGHLQTYIIPLNEILTPYQFSVHRFRKRFDFSNTGAETWDWRQAIQPDRLPSGCAKALVKRKP